MERWILESVQSRFRLYLFRETHDGRKLKQYGQIKAEKAITRLVCWCSGGDGWAAVPHGRKVPRDDIQSLNRVLGDLVKVTRQRLQQHLKTDHGHPLQGHLERLIFPLPGQGHLQIHLRMGGKRERGGGGGGTGQREVRQTKDEWGEIDLSSWRTEVSNKYPRAKQTGKIRLLGKSICLWRQQV